jgi:hypothetical protein
MLAINLPFRQIFASVIRSVVSEEKDKLLAIASMQELSTFIPNIDLQKNIDLLPIAFDACVINRGNKNGDLIDTNTALATYKTFIHKFIDTEHDRKRVIGVVLTASLSEFGTNRPLREEDVIGKDIPFNITLGGVLWKAVNEDLCDLVEEASDPTSDKYMNVSASWELGFSDYRIIELGQGNRNLSDGIIIDNPEFKEGIKKYLKCFGGSGVKDGKSYYRMPSENVVAMGIGLTEKPAAEVAGVAVKSIKEQSRTEAIAEAETIASDKIIQLNTEIISHQAQNAVKEGRELIMKITSIADITDDTLKQCTASVITQFISDELKKASDTFVAEKTASEGAAKQMQANAEALTSKVTEMQASLDTLLKEKEVRANVDAFNSRMSEVIASYEFPEDVSKVVVEDIRSIASDEAFATWKTKAATIFKPFSKTAIAAAKAKCKADEEEAESKAKKTLPFEKKDDKKDDAEPDKDGDDKKKEEKKDAKASTEAVASAVENALDNADKKDAGLPNSSSASAPGLKEKFASAFAEENFVIKVK